MPRRISVKLYSSTLQNLVMRLVLRLNRRAHVKPAHPLKARIEFKIATLVHAILHQHAPPYLSDIIQFNSTESSRRQLRSFTTKAALYSHENTDSVREACLHSLSVVQAGCELTGGGGWGKLSPPLLNFQHPVFTSSAPRGSFIPPVPVSDHK